MMMIRKKAQKRQNMHYLEKRAKKHENMPLTTLKEQKPHLFANFLYFLYYKYT